MAVQTPDCCITVGSSGAGKSTLISILTGRQARTGSGADAVTQHCEAFDDITGVTNFRYVDTKGWEDTRLESDDDVYANKMKFLQENGLKRIQALIWCVEPSERKNATIQRQAKYINDFGDGIWKNTIIQVSFQNHLEKNLCRAKNTSNRV